MFPLITLFSSKYTRSLPMSFLRPARIPLSVALATAPLGQQAHATWQQQSKLTEGNISAGDHFGSNLHLSGNRMFIGAQRGANGTGEVFVRTLDSSSASFISITPPASQDHSLSLFGNAIVERDGTLFVAAQRRDTPGTTDEPPIKAAGAVQVYQRSSSGAWQWRQTLTASNPSAEDQFGASLAFDGQTLVVSAPLRDTFGVNDSGAAYVFTKTSTGQWSQRQILTAPQPANGDRFGNNLAIDNGRLLISAHLADGVATDQGRVFAYRSASGGANFTLAQTLQAPAASLGAQFGFSLDVEGTRAVIGSPGAAVGEVASGAAYVYEFGSSGWSNAGRMLPSNTDTELEFGSKVDLSSDKRRIAVGAPTDSSAAFFGGAVHIFEKPGAAWIEKAKIVSPAAGFFDEFGRFFQIEGNRLLVGSPNDDSEASQAGAAYLFQTNQASQTPDTGPGTGPGSGPVTTPAPTPAPLGSMLSLSLIGAGLLTMRQRHLAH